MTKIFAVRETETFVLTAGHKEIWDELALWAKYSHIHAINIISITIERTGSATTLRITYWRD